MASELGLHGIAVPEEWGGAGAGMPELAVVFEEMGAALLCPVLLHRRHLPCRRFSTSDDRAAMDEFVPAIRRTASTTATLILNGSSTPGIPPR